MFATATESTIASSNERGRSPTNWAFMRMKASAWMTPAMTLSIKGTSLHGAGRGATPLGDAQLIDLRDNPIVSLDGAAWRRHSHVFRLYRVRSFRSHHPRLGRRPGQGTECPLRPRVVAAAMRQRLHQRQAGDPSTAEVADACGLSPSYFTGAVKQATDEPLYQWRKPSPTSRPALIQVNIVLCRSQYIGRARSGAITGAACDKENHHASDEESLD
jgi:AraC-like DNA-binding protein